MSLLELLGLGIVIGIFSGLTAAILGWQMGLIVVVLSVATAALMGAFNDEPY